MGNSCKVGKAVHRICVAAKNAQEIRLELELRGQEICLTVEDGSSLDFCDLLAKCSNNKTVPSIIAEIAALPPEKVEEWFQRKMDMQASLVAPGN
ncbi:hypothetical protein HYW32_01450 [Candidatus Berkelbacteria bacterium]|nr:hypothetical protein [Candidatus Berkelbacteria bacterium]